MEFFLSSVLLFAVSGGEIFIILLLVLILFGPKKIPEIARTIGKGINEVKKVQRDINAEINRYTDEIEKPVKQVTNDMAKYKDNYYHPAEGFGPSYAHSKLEPGNGQVEGVETNKSGQEAPEELPYPYNKQEISEPCANSDLENKKEHS